MGPHLRSTLFDTQNMYKRLGLTYELFKIWIGKKYGGKILEAGQQIRSKIESFQNANFLISQPNPMIEIVSPSVTTHWNRLGETISMRVTS